MRRIIFDRKGNGIVETILFIPFAFLFLFSSIDLGLAYKDRGAIIAAVNSALNEEVIFSKKYKLLYINDSAEIIKNTDNYKSFLNDINKLITKKIAETRNIKINDLLTEIKIVSSIVSLDINQDNGKLENFEFAETLSFPTADINKTALEQYVTTELSSCANTEACKFSLPQGTALNLGSFQNYRPISLLIALHIQAESYGISKNISKSLIGKIFSVDEKFLKLLRIQIS